VTTRGELWSHAARFALLQRRMFRSSRSCDQSMQLSNIIARMAYMPSIYMRVGTNRDIWFTSTILPCPRFRAVIDCKSLVSTEGHITYVCRAACLFTKLYQRRSLRLRATNVRYFILNGYLSPYARLPVT